MKQKENLLSRATAWTLGIDHGWDCVIGTKLPSFGKIRIGPRLGKVRVHFRGAQGGKSLGCRRQYVAWQANSAGMEFLGQNLLELNKACKVMW